MDRRIILQIFLIIITVPLQLFVLSKWSHKTIEQTKTIFSLNKYFTITSQINELVHYLSPNTWFNGLISFAVDDPIAFNPQLHKRTWERDVQSAAIEVYHSREKYGYFATSPTIRSPRSKDVKFRIGQVIQHKIYGYRAVIIGWDETARAPQQWLKQHTKYATRPNYSVLLDTRDQRAHKTYIPQEYIEVITNTKILNAQLTDYFNLFDGIQYRMQPWLKEQYPHDE